MRINVNKSKRHWVCFIKSFQNNWLNFSHIEPFIFLALLSFSTELDHYKILAVNSSVRLRGERQLLLMTNCLFKKIFSMISVLFVRPLITLFQSSGNIYPVFQSQGGFLTCMLHRLSLMESSDSSLVRHLQTCWWSARLPSNYD